MIGKGSCVLFGIPKVRDRGGKGDSIEQGTEHTFCSFGRSNNHNANCLRYGANRLCIRVRLVFTVYTRVPARGGDFSMGV